MTIPEKLSLLREEMRKNDIDIFVVYSADPHMSEYLPDEWKERVWLTGFTGSYGWAVVTQNKAGLWTDGRYFTQAEEELKGTGIDMYKDRVVDAVDYVEWIIEQTSENAKVAVNAMATAHSSWTDLKSRLEQNNRQLVHLPLLDKIWTNRSSDGTKNEIFVHPLKWAGESAEDKIERIRKAMTRHGATAHIMNALDDIAWVLNLRGSDVECNPVFIGYVYMTHDKTILFTDLEKLNEDAKKTMAGSKVEIKAYDTFFDFLNSVKGEKVLLAGNTNQAIFEALKSENKLITAAVPSQRMKAVKNETELEGFRTVMVRDGVAMVKFLHWLTHNVGKEPMTEYSIAEKLHGFRAAGKNFVGESFGSIVGFQGNGAIIHYSPSKDGSAQVTKDGSILIDSGGQYREGTTDITRTLPLGEVSDDFKRDYTLVIQGHIRLAMARFPKGTRGNQLDVLARMALWNEAKEYHHGTGHGVGSFLNVHEGPANIRQDNNPETLEEGMVLSNEPGYYVVGKYGIRHENLIAVRDYKTTEWGTFYDFETITWCPFFKSPIVKELLAAEEIQWLNDYHQSCKEKLGPLLEGEVKEWFMELVAPL